MTKTISRTAHAAGFLVGAALLAGLTGCMLEGTGPRSGYRSRPAVEVHGSVAVTDDYDYFPAHETYYSRNRREFVYRDGNSWVRRPQPRGLSVDLLLAAPSVRVDFRDSPERHHATVVRQYPRNWSPPGRGQDGRNDSRKDDRRDRRDDDRKN